MKFSSFISYEYYSFFFSFLDAYNFLRKLVLIFCLSYEFCVWSGCNLVQHSCRSEHGSGIQGTEQYCNLPQQLQSMLVDIVLSAFYFFLVFWDIVDWIMIVAQLLSGVDFWAHIMWMFILYWSWVQMLPTVAYADNPSTSFAAKFVHTSLNKNRCSINRVLVSKTKPSFQYFSEYTHSHIFFVNLLCIKSNMFNSLLFSPLNVFVFYLKFQFKSTCFDFGPYGCAIL